MVFAQNNTLDLSDSRFGWPAQHNWLRRYFVYERATYALKEIVAIQNINKFNGLGQKFPLCNKLCNSFCRVNQHFQMPVDRRFRSSCEILLLSIVFCIILIKVLLRRLQWVLLRRMI